MKWLCDIYVWLQFSLGSLLARNSCWWKACCPKFSLIWNENSFPTRTCCSSSQARLGPSPQFQTVVEPVVWNLQQHSHAILNNLRVFQELYTVQCWSKPADSNSRICADNRRCSEDEQAIHRTRHTLCKPQQIDLLSVLVYSSYWIHFGW